MDNFKVVDDIVICPSCGVPNRIGTYASTLRPICGKCKTSLQPDIANLEQKNKTSSGPSNVPVPLSWRKRFLYAGVGVAITFVGFGIYFNINEKPTAIQNLAPNLPKNQQSFDNLNEDASKSIQPKAHKNRARQKDIAPKNASTNAPIQSPIPLNQTTKAKLPPYQLPLTNRALSNGTVIRLTYLSGLGRLTINNGLSMDAAIKVIDTESRCKVYFYVCKNSQFTLDKLDEGKYRLIFVVGKDWDTETQLFTRNSSFSEFDRQLDFIEYTNQIGDSKYQNYSNVSLTLHPVLGGNTKTHGISEKEFRIY